MPPEFEMADALKTNASAFCAAVAITENVTLSDDRMPAIARPKASLRNGTLTFVRSGGRTFGITCQHVIDAYRRIIAENDGQFTHSMRTMLNGFYVVIDRFVRPTPQLGDPELDIAIREVDPAFPAALGKQCLEIDAMSEPPVDLAYAFAVGFPETLKYEIHEGHQYKVSMPQMEIVAELSGCPDRRFVMASQLEEDLPHLNFSGMSGGPIFWSTADEFGLLGITYEGGPGSFGPSVRIYGELATPNIVRGWLDQVPVQRAG